MAKILDVKIDNMTFTEVRRTITQFFVDNNFHQIVTINPEFILEAQKDSDFKRVLNTAGLSIPDGYGLKIAGLLTRQKIGERVTGVDLTWEIAKLAAEKDKSLFLLGAASGVAEKVAKRLKLVYPSLKIAGTYAGSPDDDDIIDIIKKAKPDILLVAYGAPEQDKFIDKLKIAFRHSNCKFLRVAMGVGGTFDYIAGIVPRAPKWLRSMGLEWFYRLFKQPKRLGRIYNAVIKFPILVLISLFR